MIVKKNKNIIKNLKHFLLKNKNNRQIIKDVLLLFVATIIFHLLYWNTNMNHWIFGSFTADIFKFFTNIAYKSSAILCNFFINKPFDMTDTSFLFYHITDNGIKVYDSTMSIVEECSGIKQVLQFLLIMILSRGNWIKKSLYFLVGSVIILIANILRIFLLTSLFAYNPDNFEPIHSWIARPFMYIIIFGLWVVWIEFFVNNKLKNKTT